MDYQFTMLTVSQKISTGGNGMDALGQSPWSNVQGAIAMPGATLSTITLSDDDNRFQSGRYAPDATGQTLTTAVRFGNDAADTPAGTALSFHTVSIIHSQNPDGTHDEFMALFPRKVVPLATGPELGGRFSVLLMPIAREDGSFPVFSLSRTYTFKGLQTVGRANDLVDYGPPAAGAVPCFAAGTLIQTPFGSRPVESLHPGDLVTTRDHGCQVLRWRGGAHVSPEGLELRPNLRPILIRAGSLGAGSPATDLVVSPQHRMLVRSRIAHRMFEDSEILAAAKHLVGLPGIEVIVPPKGVTYTTCCSTATRSSCRTGHGRKASTSVRRQCCP